MAQYNSLKVKLSKSKLNKLKSEIKNDIEVALNPSSNTIGISNSETNFPRKLLLTDAQVSRLCRAFANKSSPNMKEKKTCKICTLFWTITKNHFRLNKNWT